MSKRKPIPRRPRVSKPQIRLPSSEIEGRYSRTSTPSPRLRPKLTVPAPNLRPPGQKIPDVRSSMYNRGPVLFRPCRNEKLRRPDSEEARTDNPAARPHLAKAETAASHARPDLRLTRTNRKTAHPAKAASCTL